MWGVWRVDYIEEETRGPTYVFKGGQIAERDC